MKVLRIRVESCGSSSAIETKLLTGANNSAKQLVKKEVERYMEEPCLSEMCCKDCENCTVSFDSIADFLLDKKKTSEWKFETKGNGAFGHEEMTLKFWPEYDPDVTYISRFIVVES